MSSRLARWSTCAPGGKIGAGEPARQAESASAKAIAARAARARIGRAGNSTRASIGSAVRCVAPAAAQIAVPEQIEAHHRVEDRESGKNREPGRGAEIR